MIFCIVFIFAILVMSLTTITQDLDDDYSDVIYFNNGVRYNPIFQPSILGSVPEEYIRIVKDGFDKEKARFIDFTNLLRLGYLFPDIIYPVVGFRGVPICWGVNDDGLPSETPFSILPHQIESLEWMKKREREDVYGIKGGILCLEMGMGKTLTTFVHILSSPLGDFPSLVIVSKTVMSSWMNEEKKFFGDYIKVLYYHKEFLDSSVYNNICRDDIRNYDIIVTTYDVVCSVGKKGNYVEECIEYGDEHTLMKNKIVAIHPRTRAQVDKKIVRGPDILFCTPWERVVCDESQRFANSKTTIYKCIMSIYGKYKWCLSGTPIRNYNTDIWSQFRFCGYTSVTSEKVWSRIGLGLMKSQNLRVCIFTMKYPDAGIILPPKVENDIVINLDEMERKVYNHILEKTKRAYNEFLKKICKFSCVLALFTRLRQCAIAPYLMTASSKRDKLHKTIKEREIQYMTLLSDDTGIGKWCTDKYGNAGIKSKKIMSVISIINKIPPGEKILICSSYTSALDLLGDSIKEHIPGFGYLQLDGDTVGFERINVINNFKMEPNIRALLFTYKVGGEGLNLTVANHCIPLEPWWCPSVPNQAKARCYRTGQKKNVNVYNIIAKDTIEDKILEIAKYKEDMAKMYLSGTTKKAESTRLDRYTLGRILGIYH